MSAYDPMTALSVENMDALAAWWRNGAVGTLELPNETSSGGTLTLRVDDGMVWITPEP